MIVWLVWGEKQCSFLFFSILLFQNNVYQQIFHHATLSNRIFLDETINFVQNFNTISYPDIAYVVASSGNIEIDVLFFARGKQARDCES